MEALALLVRWIHLLAASSLLGTFAFLLLVGRSAARASGPDAWSRFSPLDARLMGIALWVLGTSLVSGGLDLWHQVAVATGLSLGESLAIQPFATVLAETRYGIVWLVRHALLLLLGALLVLREEEHDGANWLALRLEGVFLAAAALVIGAAAGHAASAQGAPGPAITVDALHLLATGVWLGGLLPLVLFFRWAASLPDGSAATAAAAARRFSAIGLAAVSLLVVTGTSNTWQQVASFPALFGTPYGQWLVLKLLLLLPLLLAAGLNLLVSKPPVLRAAHGAADLRHPALLTGLRRRVVVEAVLGGTILAVVAVLGLTTPARHAPVTWPFPFRLTWDATKDLPGVQTRVAIGSQVAVLGLVAALLALIVRRRHWGRVMGTGLAAVGLGLAVAVPSLAVDAHPTTYRRPTVPYTADSIAQGHTLYRGHCASCHGVGGRGDGPAAGGQRGQPGDLTARRTAAHTVGDLFWSLTHGIPRSAMPGFANRLSEDERWAVINFVRILAAAEAARTLGPVAVPRPAIVAPDFAYTTGVGEGRALKDYRGQGSVLLVLFSLPDSVDRLVQLNEAYPALRARGAEVLGIPVRPSPRLYHDLGARPIFFPLVLDGAAEAVATYALFAPDRTPPLATGDTAPPAHMELLVDRQGYVRARWHPKQSGAWSDLGELIAEVERLARERPQAPAPDDHVH